MVTTKTGTKTRLRNAMLQRGMTQAEVARQADVPVDFVHKAFQRGSVPRDREIREDIARALDVTSQWLWFGAKQEDAKPLFKQDAAEAPFLMAPDPKGYIVPIRDENVSPWLSPGDVLYVTPSREPRLGDRVIYEVDGEFFAGNFRKLDETHLTVITHSGQEKKLEREKVGRVHRIGAVLLPA